MTNPTPNPNPSGYWTPNSAPRFGGAPGRPPTNVWAWTGFIVSVSGFVANLGINGAVGIVFSVLGLRDARRLAEQGHAETGRKLALIGLIVGIVHVVATTALAIFGVYALYWFVDWVESLPAVV